MMIKLPIPAVVAIFISCAGMQAQDDTRVLNRWLQHSDARNSLYHHLAAEAYQLLDSREKKVAGIATPGEWKERQGRLIDALWDVVGRFPERTPLNPQVTGITRKEGFRIENIIYESLPGFYVTASLFIPDNLTQPTPAILFCSGHSTEAYRRQSYQVPLLNLVRKGFIVLAIDPIGQGERLQYFNPDTGVSAIGSSTKEHSYPSTQVALMGQSIARYFIWDGIRTIDYLVGRPEVDSRRIGVHGLSGGGTQTAHISALDQRVAASAVACYITSYRRLIESIGVQDGEQNFYHGIAREIDHADFIAARAPRPTLIMANTGDYFSIEGARETYEEVKEIYRALGSARNLEMVEDDHGHGYTRKTREALYAFFQKHLSLPGSPAEEEVEFLTAQELQKTPTGQLSTSLGGETVFSLNRREAEGLAGRLEQSRREPEKHLSQAILSAKRLSGYREPSISDRAVFTGRTRMEGHAVEKYFIKGEGDYVIPYLLFVPDRAGDKAVVYLHPDGKAAAASANGEMEWLMREGFTVLATDILGTGEMGNAAFRGDAYIDNVSYNMWYTAMLVGRSIVGIQAADVVKLSHWLIQERGMAEIFGLARGEMSPVLLHAAAFDRAISRVALISPYGSYRAIATSRFYSPKFVYSMVPGALTGYDLPDLAASLAPNGLTIAGMTDARGGHSDAADIRRDLGIMEEAYRRVDAGNRLKVVGPDSVADVPGLLREWTK
jgi:dienelactone hydrolase